jgi:hypothetical protein
MSVSNFQKRKLSQVDLSKISLISANVSLERCWFPNIRDCAIYHRLYPQAIKKVVELEELVSLAMECFLFQVQEFRVQQQEELRNLFNESSG